MTVICILLFIGAMGKSAQFPLHVWLPDSMEGPTPISALIHAATMVTAGIFMVARMSPLFELSATALSFVLIIGAITAFFMGLVGIVKNDIKRVVAYSTLSQLGYMTVALGASAYAAGMFHLMTHAFFKALLFLAAGSVIIAMHHEQDMRKMGGLRKYMPITYWTTLIGALALCGIPPFAGFFSKDTIIEAVQRVAHAGRRHRLCRGAGGRVRHRAVHLPHDVHDLPRQGALRSAARARRARQPGDAAHGHDEHSADEHGARPRTCRPAARVALGGDRAADRCWRFPRSMPAGPTSARCCSAASSAASIVVDPAHDLLAKLARGIPRRRRRSRCTGSSACRSGWRSPGSSPPGICT